MASDYLIISLKFLGDGSEILCVSSAQSAPGFFFSFFGGRGVGEACFFCGAAGLRKFAVSGSQGSLAYSMRFSSSSQKEEQQTWIGFKEGNKEDQRISL